MTEPQIFFNWVSAGFAAIAFDLAIALIILVIGWAISSWVGGMVRRMATRSTRIDPTIVPIVYTVTIWGIRVIVLVAVLARLGVQTASMIAVLGAAGLAIALSLQGTLQNIASGIMLLALRPFRAGDFVSVVGSVDGMVDEVGLFMTQFKQYDGTYIIVPNSNIWGSAILNLSRHDTRRAQAQVLIPYGEDINLAMAELEKLAKTHELALDEPAPMVMVSEYRDHAMLVTVRAWAEAGNWFELQNDLNRRAQDALRQAGVELPPSRPVRVVT